MLKTLLLLSLSASTALALDSTSLFFKRQTSCAIGWKPCGEVCVRIEYTCCPDLQGGCPTATSQCWLGTNGQYGCCPRGQRCTGPGGVDTEPGGTNTIVSTQTLTLPGDVETSTTTSTSISTFTVNVPGVPTPTVQDEVETTTTTTSTSISVPAITNDTKTTTFVAPPNATITRTSPVTVNGAPAYGTPVLQAVAAGAVALLAI